MFILGEVPFANFVILGDGMSDAVTVDLAASPVAYPFVHGLPSGILPAVSTGGPAVIDTSIRGSRVTFKFDAPIPVGGVAIQALTLKWEL